MKPKKLTAQDITNLGKMIEANPEIEAVRIKIKLYGSATVLSYETTESERIERIHKFYKTRGMKLED